jgi:hypothetical protein
LTKPVQEDQLIAVVAQLIGSDSRQPSPQTAVTVS